MMTMVIRKDKYRLETAKVIWSVFVCSGEVTAGYLTGTHESGQWLLGTLIKLPAPDDDDDAQDDVKMEHCNVNQSAMCLPVHIDALTRITQWR